MAVGGLALRFPGFKFSNIKSLGWEPKGGPNALLAAKSIGSAGADCGFRGALSNKTSLLFRFWIGSVGTDCGFRRNRPWQGAGDVAPNPRT